jgi:hypothetical protein
VGTNLGKAALVPASATTHFAAQGSGREESSSEAKQDELTKRALPKAIAAKDFP